MKKKLITQFAAVAVGALVVGFAGGMFVGKGQGAPAGGDQVFGNGFRNGPSGQFQAGSNNGARRVGMGGGFMNGEVIAKDTSSITVKLQDGSSKIILFSGTTQISRFAAGTMDDIAVGSRVTVNGPTNSDGSVTAQMIQLRPEGVGGSGGGPTSTQPVPPAQ